MARERVEAGELDSECENENENGRAKERRGLGESMNGLAGRYGRRGAAKITIGFHVPYTQTRRIRMYVPACVVQHSPCTAHPLTRRKTLRRARARARTRVAFH